jgi:hypothetical protein
MAGPLGRLRDTTATVLHEGWCAAPCPAGHGKVASGARAVSVRLRLAFAARPMLVVALRETLPKRPSTFVDRTELHAGRCPNGE